MTIRHLHVPHIKTALLSLLLLAALSADISAQLFAPPGKGFTIDLPVGFECVQQDPDGNGYLFSYNMLPVTLIIKLYDKGACRDAAGAAATALGKLRARYETAVMQWNGAECAISSFSMTLPGSETGQEGWAAAAPLPNESGWLTAICYADQDRTWYCARAINSALDSLCIGEAGRRTPGIMTSFAFPGTGKKEVTLTIHGKKVKSAVGSDDAEANKYVVEREYAILTLYARNKNWLEAWRRYYRMIHRDACRRTARLAADIYKTLYPAAVKADSKNPDMEYIRQLLSWIQEFSYVRDPQNADFTDIVSCATGSPSDCDSRSLLLCILAEHAGIQSALFISREYSHAIAGLALSAGGAKITVNGTAYLLAETTAKVDPGLVAQDMSDESKWIAVELP